jgi:ParB family chromosome partitioning protein
MTAKKGLGRSFSSLIPTELLDESFDPTAAQDEKISELRHIKLTEIVADPDQPRRTFDESGIDEMAMSIREHGILQPIVVTPHGAGYQIVAGERRFRASRKAGLDKIPALVRTLGNQHKLELSLIENLHRRDLNALEIATAYLKLRDQFNMTLDEIGSRSGGKSVSAISNTLRLLRLPEAARQAIAEGKLSEGQARPLIGLEEAIINEILPKILKEEWTARRVEQFVVGLKNGDEQNRKKPKKSEPVVVHVENVKKLEKRFSTAIQIKTNAKGAGRIVIAFKNEDDFARIQRLLNE